MLDLAIFCLGKSLPKALRWPLTLTLLTFRSCTFPGGSGRGLDGRGLGRGRVGARRSGSGREWVVREGSGLAWRGGRWRVKSSARRRCPLNWNGKQLPVDSLGRAPPIRGVRDRRGIPELWVRNFANELFRWNPSSTTAGNLCVWARAVRWQYGCRRERSRGAAETTSSQSGEGRCGRETTWVCVPERTREGLFEPATSAQQRSPRLDALWGGFQPSSASSARGHLTSSPGKRGGRACDVRVSSGPRHECPRLLSGQGLSSGS